MKSNRRLNKPIRFCRTTIKKNPVHPHTKILKFPKSLRKEETFIQLWTITMVIMALI